MKRLVSFNPIKSIAPHSMWGSPRHYAAVIEVEETGIWWWRKEVSRTRVVAKDHAFWYFVDSGQYTPGTEVEALARAYEATKELEKALEKQP